MDLTLPDKSINFFQIIGIKGNVVVLKEFAKTIWKVCGDVRDVIGQLTVLTVWTVGFILCSVYFWKQG
jgi:hypothetical protein